MSDDKKFDVERPFVVDGIRSTTIHYHRGLSHCLLVPLFLVSATCSIMKYLQASRYSMN